MADPRSAPTSQALRSALHVSWISVIWTIIASSSAVAAGLERGSLVLVVFGATSALDGAGSLTLAFHFRHAVANESVSTTRERLALRVVSGGLIAIGLFTIVESTRRLLGDSTTERSTLGIAVAAASVVVLTALTTWKRAAARQVRSKALAADGTLSATGAALAVVVLVGTAFSSRANLHWIDPATALIVAVLAAASGVSALRSEERALAD